MQPPEATERGSAVGLCGDVLPPIRLLGGHWSPSLVCHLAYGHMGMHSDGTTTWTATRCWSCDHEIAMHKDEGCWYTVEVGTPGRDLVCPCTVPVDSIRYGKDTE